MKFKLYHVVYPVIIEWNLAKRGIRDPAPTAYSPLSMWCKNCVKSGTYFSVFIIAAMVSKPSNALVGAEIAKDLALAGVKELVICDESLVTISDIGTQFFLRESDVGMNRALCTCPRLSELNPSVSVSVFGV